MDMSKLLPLLMSKNGANNDRVQTLMKLAGGEKPDVGTVMNMALESRKTRLIGLKPISEIASYEIMGKLSKHFL